MFMDPVSIKFVNFKCSITNKFCIFFQFAGGLTCYCEGIHCPKASLNGTCEMKQGGKCFVSLDRQYDEETQTYEYYKDFGCFNADDVNFQVCVFVFDSFSLDI